MKIQLIGVRDLRSELGQSKAAHVQESYKAHATVSQELDLFFPSELAEEVLAFLDFTSAKRVVHNFSLRPSGWQLYAVDRARFLLWVDHEVQCWNLEDLSVAIFSGQFLHPPFGSSDKICFMGEGARRVYFRPKTNTWEEVSCNTIQRHRTINLVWFERDGVKSELIACEKGSIIKDEVHSDRVVLQVDGKIVSCCWTSTGFFTSWILLVQEPSVLLKWWSNASFLCWTAHMKTAVLDMRTQQQLYSLSARPVNCFLSNDGKCAVLHLANGVQYDLDLKRQSKMKTRRWHPALSTEDEVSNFHVTDSGCVAISVTGQCSFFHGKSKLQYQFSQNISFFWQIAVVLENRCVVTVRDLGRTTLEVLI